MTKTAFFVFVSSAVASFTIGATPTTAEASIAAPTPVTSGKDCSYDNLSCVAGTGTCVMCGRGANRTCKEDHTGCYWIGY